MGAGLAWTVSLRHRSLTRKVLLTGDVRGYRGGGWGYGPGRCRVRHIAVMMPPTMSMVRMASAWPETLPKSLRVSAYSWYHAHQINDLSEEGNNAAALRSVGITRPDPALHDPEHRAGATAPHRPGYGQCSLMKAGPYVIQSMMPQTWQPHCERLGFEVTLLRDAKMRAMEEAIEAFSVKLRKGGSVGLFLFCWTRRASGWRELYRPHRCPHQPRTGRALRDDTGWTYHWVAWKMPASEVSLIILDACSR